MPGLCPEQSFRICRYILVDQFSERVPGERRCIGNVINKCLYCFDNRGSFNDVHSTDNVHDIHNLIPSFDYNVTSSFEYNICDLLTNVLLSQLQHIIVLFHPAFTDLYIHPHIHQYLVGSILDNTNMVPILDDSVVDHSNMVSALPLHFPIVDRMAQFQLCPWQ